MTTKCSVPRNNALKHLRALFFIILILIFCGLAVNAETASLPPHVSFNADYKEYKIKPGDTLSSLGQRFHTSVNALKLINNHPSNNVSRGKILRYSAIIESVSMESTAVEILAYRIYAAKNILYLLAIARTAAEEEDWKWVLLFRQAGEKWVLVDSLIYMDYLGEVRWSGAVCSGY